MRRVFVVRHLRSRAGGQAATGQTAADEPTVDLSAAAERSGTGSGSGSDAGADSGSDSGTGSGSASARRRNLSEWTKILVVPIAVAVAITALTPIGDGLREVLFPTSADVSGTVVIGGKPAVGAELRLDGEGVGVTDGGGAYLLSDVGNGKHTLSAAAVGARPAQTTFTVQRGGTGTR